MSKASSARVDLVAHDAASCEPVLKFLHRSGVEARVVRPGIDALGDQTRPALAIVVVSEELDAAQLPSRPEQLADVVVVAVTSPQIEPPGLFAQLQRIELADSSAAFWNALRAASITPASESLLLPRGVTSLPPRHWSRYLVLPLAAAAVIAIGIAVGTRQSRPREQAAIAEAIDKDVAPGLDNYFAAAASFLGAIDRVMKAPVTGVSQIVAVRGSLAGPVDRFNESFTAFHQAHPVALVRLAETPIPGPQLQRCQRFFDKVLKFHWDQLRNSLNLYVLSHLYAVDGGDTSEAALRALQVARGEWNRLALQQELERLKTESGRLRTQVLSDP